MPGNLDDTRKKVVDEQTFIDFLYALATDRANEVAMEREHPTPWAPPGGGGWEQGTIEGYLYAAARWAEARVLGRPKATNPWRRCADILYMGKIYE